MEYLIWSAVSIILYEISVTDQGNSGLLEDPPDFASGDESQLLLPLGKQPRGSHIQIVVNEARMTHQLMRSRFHGLNYVGKGSEIEKPRLRDSIKTPGTDQADVTLSRL